MLEEEFEVSTALCYPLSWGCVSDLDGTECYCFHVLGVVNHLLNRSTASPGVGFSLVVFSDPYRGQRVKISGNKLPNFLSR